MHDAMAIDSPVLHSIGFDVSTDPDRGTIVLIDGAPLPAQTDQGFLGFLPEELFAADVPLMPRQRPRRVAVARCSCGETGCGNITPLVGVAGDDDQYVVWRDFRDLGSAVSSPSEIDRDAFPEDAARVGHDDLVFDRVQYEAAVLAASADRSWEGPDETTARLLRGLLATDAGALRSLGFVLTWLAPSWERPGWWTVSLVVPHPHRTPAQLQSDADADAGRSPRRTRSRWTVRAVPLRLRPWEREPRQVLLELSTPPAPPIAQAADLYRQLTDVPLADWERHFGRTDPRG